MVGFEETLESKWLVRQEVWSLFLSSLQQGYSIYLWGSSGTGKTLLVKDAFTHTGISSIYINCVEYFTFKSLFKSIKASLVALFNLEGPKSDDPHKFAIYLQSLHLTQSVFVILDKAQKLLKLDLLIVHKLLEVSRLSGIQLQLVIITDCYNDDLFIHPDTIDRAFSPVRIYLPEYTPKQLSVILRKSFSYGSDEEFETFFENISNLLYPYTSNIFHYITAFQKTYEIYLNFDAKNPIERTMEAIKRELRSVESAFFQKFKAYKEYQQGLSLEAKILIVSGFICSKNPPKLDSILLKGKRKSEKRRVLKENSDQPPPERFSLQRLQSVYSIILHLIKDCSTRDILSSPIETPAFCSLVNTLIRKNIFIKVSKKDPLGCEKFMCTSEYDFCRQVSKSLDLDLSEFVIDIS